jgi:hypothetical protein
MVTSVTRVHNIMKYTFGVIKHRADKGTVSFFYSGERIADREDLTVRRSILEGIETTYFCLG